MDKLLEKRDTEGWTDSDREKYKILENNYNGLAELITTGKAPEFPPDMIKNDPILKHIIHKK
ncbi:MAG: hypothetical protein U5O15_00725 [Candidatus Krumholzibacteriota bacterium]|nr:hypothetical protein [Candidatus Krumholzibacteriota bacterium]